MDGDRASLPAGMRTSFGWHSATVVARLEPGITLQRARDSLSTSSQSASLLGAFAMLALLLASLGIYGVLSYAVAHRSNEIGVRMALGATAGEILRSFTRQGLGLTVFGLVVGLAAAGAASRLLTTLLYGYRPDYFSTAAAVSIILIVVAALACLVPARRASRTDPMIALRRE